VRTETRDGVEVRERHGCCARMNPRLLYRMPAKILPVMSVPNANPNAVKVVVCVSISKFLPSPAFLSLLSRPLSLSFLGGRGVQEGQTPTGDDRGRGEQAGRTEGDERVAAETGSLAIEKELPWAVGGIKIDKIKLRARSRFLSF